MDNNCADYFKEIRESVPAQRTQIRGAVKILRKLRKQGVNLSYIDDKITAIIAFDSPTNAAQNAIDAIERYGRNAVIRAIYVLGERDGSLLKIEVHGDRHIPTEIVGTFQDGRFTLSDHPTKIDVTFPHSEGGTA